MFENNYQKQRALNLSMSYHGLINKYASQLLTLFFLAFKFSNFKFMHFQRIKKQLKGKMHWIFFERWTDLRSGPKLDNVLLLMYACIVQLPIMSNMYLSHCFMTNSIITRLQVLFQEHPFSLYKYCSYDLFITYMYITQLNSIVDFTANRRL